MKLENHKILVTGADGFIGSHMVETLVRRGCSVTAFIYYNSFNSWGWLDHAPEEIKNRIEIFPGDIRDPQCIEKAMQECELVIHLAALVSIPYSYQSVKSFVDTNIQGTLNMAQAAVKLKVKKFIHTSTSEVYGTAVKVPINEDHPIQPQSPYSASKIGADAIAMSFYHSFGLPLTIARPFNTYGPRQSARAVIPSIITQIALGKNEIKLGRLTPTRDFTFVQDTCNGIAALLENDSAIGEKVNIGSNQEISIEKIANMIPKLMEREIKITSEDQRLRPESSEVFRLRCDNTKLKTLTGFEPSYSIKNGLEKTIEWFSNPKNLGMYKADTYYV